MVRSLDKRLRKLETRLLAERDKDEEFCVHFALLLLDAFGYYFGDPKPGEAPEAATARALGYEHGDKLSEAITNPEFDEKYERAKCKLFGKFGVDLETANGQGIAEAAKRLYAELPGSYKARAWWVMPIHDNVWRCRPIDLPTDRSMSRKSRVFTLDIRRHFDRSVNGPTSHGGVS